MKWLTIILFLLFCIVCKANSEQYFCEFYMPDIPENETVSGFDRIITINNSASHRTLLLQWEPEPLLHSTDEDHTLISVYPSMNLSHYHSFYVYKFDTIKKILYISLVIHVSVEEFRSFHKVRPTKKNINKLNTDPDAIQYTPEREYSNWVVYAFPRMDYYNCTQLNDEEYVLKSFLLIIEGILSGI